MPNSMLRIWARRQILRQTSLQRKKWVRCRVTLQPKKKYEGLIKKVKADLKKKKAAAKKKFMAQMKNSAKQFAKLYAPIKGAKKNEMGAPLGSDGQAGISSMVRWAYATQVSA